MLRFKYNFYLIKLINNITFDYNFNFFSVYQEYYIKIYILIQ